MLWAGSPRRHAVVRLCRCRAGPGPVLGPSKSGIISVFRFQVHNFSDKAPAPPLASEESRTHPEEISNQVPQWARPTNNVTNGLARSLTCQTPSMPKSRQKQSLGAVISTYIELAKPRLTALVVLSAMSAYALAPHELSLSKLAVLTVGTLLCSSSANAINMGREPEYDRLMSRTRTRPVASGKLTPQQAFKFATATGVTGISVLAAGLNPTVAALGAANIALYGGLYTSLKRVSIANTWVGAVVGAIPPLMGWAAQSSLMDPGAWMLAGLLYSWQFPHFMALSYVIGEEYKAAGYVMSGWTDPQLTARVALRHSIAMFPLSIGLSYFGVTDPFFILDSSIVNGWLVYTSYKFWQQQRQIAIAGPGKHSGEDKTYARQLFWASVIHLPAILVLSMVHKKGQWDWLFA